MLRNCIHFQRSSIVIHLEINSIGLEINWKLIRGYLFITYFLLKYITYSEPCEITANLVNQLFVDPVNWHPA